MGSLMGRGIPCTRQARVPTAVPTAMRPQRRWQRGMASSGSRPVSHLAAVDELGSVDNAVRSCTAAGFRIGDGPGGRVEDGSGVLLVAGQAFRWRPWQAGRLVNARGQFEVPREAFGVLALLWPRPDLLLLGTGPQMLPLSPATRRELAQLGLVAEAMDTRTAAAEYNMLAEERDGAVAAALVPLAGLPPTSGSLE